MKKDLRTGFNNPSRWKLVKVLRAIQSIAKFIKKEPKYSKDWYIMQVKREIYALKKHIIFLEQIVDKYNKN